PQPHRAVGAGRRQRLTVGREGRGEDLARVSGEWPKLLPRGPVPQLDLSGRRALVPGRSELAAAGRDQELAVRREGHGTNPVVVAGWTWHVLAGGQVDKLHLPGPRPKRELLAVRGERQAQRGVYIPVVLQFAGRDRLLRLRGRRDGVRGQGSTHQLPVIAGEDAPVRVGRMRPRQRAGRPVAGGRLEE